MTSASAISPISFAPSTAPPGFRRADSARPRAGCARFSKNAWRYTDYGRLRTARPKRALQSESNLYDHIGLKVGNLDASVRFYTAALAPLGYVLCSRDESGAGFGPKGEPALWL